LKNLLYILIVLWFYSCKNEYNQNTLFASISESGIEFNNTLKNSKNLNILNYLYFYNGAGVAIADFNNDELNDIYFTGNQVSDRLYLNKGEFHFKDITTSAFINNKDGWTTGVTTVDINQDGLIDIYVCKVSKHLNLQGHNLLYVNQGLNDEGIPQFTEQSEAYGLNFSGYSTQATFFDYDLDGDLDMYLLNHSLYPNSNYGNGKKRLGFDALAGDILFKNENGVYKDVSKEAGIYQGTIGYGLGISVSDINNDGYPDLYIGNDFFENDYLYINQQDGTFKEVNSKDKALGHTTHFSMGNAIADINNDLNSDIISMDMLPEDLKTLKSAATEYNYSIYQRYIKNGYNHQFMQNTLHFNQGNETFSEIAFLSGIASTEWSWSPLVADFDNDGLKDLYITNGIKGVTNDMDFVNFISDEKIQKQLGSDMDESALNLVKELPQKKVPNYMFRNKNGLLFEDVTEQWITKKPTFSNGAAYTDFDNDGDLDIVVNEVDDLASIYKNKTSETKAHNYIKIAFKGSEKNRNGIGAKVVIYSDHNTLTAENYTTTGYLSAKEPSLHFGLGTNLTIDSLQVVWPTKAWQTIINPAINKVVTVNYSDAKGDYYKDLKSSELQYLQPTNPFISYKHNDQETLDFNRDPLLPYSLTNNGPDIEIGDLNNDGLEDIIITGAKKQSTEIWIQNKEQKFKKLDAQVLRKDAISDDTSIALIDVNGDEKKEIVIVSGGNEFKQGKPLQPRLYYFKNGEIVKDSVQFNTIEINASKVSGIDIDNDGYEDLCITSNVVAHQFGQTPKQYILKNNGNGEFKDVTNHISKDFRTIGNVYDIVWKDLDKNGFKDAIIVGHWMPITIFMNDGKQLSLAVNNGLENTSGWWNTLVAEDFDNDGDIDILAGNWGLNTRLRANKKEPIRLYRYDFDDNGSKETLVTYFYKGIETTIATKDELVKQLPKLNKNYLSYNAFGNATIKELFGKKQLQDAYQKEVFLLESCYFENVDNTSFKIHKLPLLTQNSSINHILVDDLNSDGYKDVILTGNNFEISTQLGRLDASHGIALLNDKNGFFNTKNLPLFDIFGQIRDIEPLTLKDQKIFVIGRHRDSLLFYKKQN